MSVMIDRMTAVLRDKLDHHGNISDEELRSCADALLVAMQEPTEAMCEAGARSSFGEPGLPKDEAGEVWRDMIGWLLRG